MAKTHSFQLSFDWEEIERSRFDPNILYREPSTKRLCSLPEGQHFDQKSGRIDPKKLAETICAFSNTDARGGVVAVGVENGVIEGFEHVGEAKLNRLLTAAIDYCPQAICQSKTVSLEEKTVLLFRVEHHSHRVVELTDGSVYLRVGDQNRRLSVDQVHQLRHDKGEISFELEPVIDASASDLDDSLVADFANAVRAAEHLEFDKSNEDILCQRRLLKYEGGRSTPRSAAILLFGKDPIRFFPGCKIHFIRYEGTQERTGVELNVIKDAMIEDAIPRLIARTAEVVFSQLREFQALQPDGRFLRVEEYPHDCVYEAIVNACVHRSYSIRNAPIFVRMFDDRLEIESPGGFVPPVTPETIYDHHVPRNPILMDALRYHALVRCANEGTRRMKHLMEASGLPHPVFEQQSDRLSKVVVTLRNKIEQRRTWVDHDLSQVVGAQLAASLSPEEIRVLNYLAEHQKMTVSDAFRITTVKTWHTARKIMGGLLKKGLVEEVKKMQRDPKAHFILAPMWGASSSASSQG